MMRHLLPAFLLPVTLLACTGPAPSDVLLADDAPISGDMEQLALRDRVAQAIGAQQDPAKTASGTRTHVLQSTQFQMPFAELDLPADWQLIQDPRNGSWSVKGPGVTVQNSANAMFTYSQDPAEMQMAAMSGRRVRPLVPAEQIVRQDLLPIMQGKGATLVGQEDAPAIASADQRGMDPLWSVAPTRKTCRANVSEWNNSDGTKTLAVMHLFIFEGQGSVNWGYNLTLLDTDAARFAQARTGLLAALASWRYNPQYFAAYNANEQQRSQKSWADHNARMRNDQANFDAQQRNYRANADATNDAIMGVYRSQRDAGDRGQEQFIDVMRGEQNAVDPYTGQPIKIESGAKQYWMNQYGEYYGTDDVLNDPNVGNTTNYNWQQVPTEP